MRKTTLIKALALLLSFAMLMTGLPAPSIAETIATPTDTVIEQSEEIVIEDEQPVEEVPDEPLVPDEETEIPPIEDEMATEPEIPMEDDEDATFPEDNPLPDDDAGDLPARSGSEYGTNQIYFQNTYNAGTRLRIYVSE
mgnify:CR=1 FL=1